jgi:hypothetical protein
VQIGQRHVVEIKKTGVKLQGESAERIQRLKMTSSWASLVQLGVQVMQKELDLWLCYSPTWKKSKLGRVYLGQY